MVRGNDDKMMILEGGVGEADDDVIKNSRRQAAKKSVFLKDFITKSHSNLNFWAPQ